MSVKEQSEKDFWYLIQGVFCSCKVRFKYSILSYNQNKYTKQINANLNPSVLIAFISAMIKS